MSLPAGITTATVTVGVPVTFTGAAVKTFVSIEPSAFLVHAATGTPLVDFLEEMNISEGVAGQYTLPHTDQAGFIDESGNAYTNWYYTARVTYSTPSKAKNKAPKVKVFQLTTGQVDVDLDLLPGGAPALPYIAPTATVTAFGGRTGPVVLEESDLPARLADAALNATIATATVGKLDKTEAATTYATPASVASALTPIQKIKRRPDNITWITQFQTGHGWTGEADIDLNSAEVRLGGTQGIKFGPADPGLSRTLFSPNPITPTVNLTDRVLVVAVKSLDNNGGGLEVWLANAAFSAYRIYYPDKLNHQAEDGWTFLTIHPNANTGGTGTLDIAAVERMRIKFTDPSGVHTEHLGAIGYAPIPATYPNGVVTIDFDDNATGQFELARPLMIAKGYPGTIYAIGDTADSRADGAMSVNDMHMLEDLYGWEVGAHSRLVADHVAMQGLTDAQIKDSVLRMRQWLTEKRFRANSFAYPNGGSDTRVRDEVRKYFSIGRRTGYTPLMMNVPMTSGQYTYGAAFNTTSASILPLIDAASARKQWLSLGFHGFITGASSGANMGTTDFGVVLDYIQSKGMAVVTSSTLFGLSR